MGWFVQKLLREKKTLAVSFNHTYRYIDDVLVIINNHNYTVKLEIKDTIESDKYASYLDILFDIDSSGRLTTVIYHLRLLVVRVSPS
jgi:hypothetical protein